MFTSFVVTTRKRANYVYPAANLNWQTFTIVFAILDLYVPVISLTLAVLQLFRH